MAKSKSKSMKEIFKLAKELVALKKLKKKLGPMRPVKHECVDCHHKWKSWAQEGTCRMCGNTKLNILF